MMAPYKTTMVFDEKTLPNALRREHRTKPGVWGVIRMLEGKLQLYFPDGRTELLTPEQPGLVRPEETHWVEPDGRMTMQVEFHDCEPERS